MAKTRNTTKSIRGSLKPARANARTVAALTGNPGCTRRRVLDAAAVPSWSLAETLGHASDRGQSPFAIVTGNRFEYRLKKGTKYELLIEALRPFVDLPDGKTRVLSLESVPGYRIGDPMLKARAKKTEDVLLALASGSRRAPHIVDHPVLILDLAGTPVYLEPDGLACRVGNHLELVEIKSFAVIDEQADPDKLSSTAGQVGVYVLALRATLTRLGLDPERVADSCILVAPRNFGRTPTAHRIPLRKKVMALERVLTHVPKTSELLAGLPVGFTLDVDPEEQLPAAKRRRALDKALGELPMLYVPECLDSCDLGKYCRHQAVREDDPARLGRVARDSLAGVETLKAALELARRPSGRVPESQAAVAEELRSAYSAIERARATAPSACGLKSAAKLTRRRRKR